MNDIAIKIVIGIIVLGGLIWGIVFENRPAKKTDEETNDNTKDKND